MGLMINAAGAANLPMPDLKKYLKTRAQIAEENMPNVRPVFSSLLENKGENSSDACRQQNRGDNSTRTLWLDNKGGNSVKNISDSGHEKVGLDNEATTTLLTEIAETSAAGGDFDIRDEDFERYEDTDWDDNNFERSRFKGNGDRSLTNYRREGEKFLENEYYDDRKGELEERTLSFDRNTRVPRRLRTKNLKFSAYRHEKMSKPDNLPENYDIDAYHGAIPEDHPVYSGNYNDTESFKDESDLAYSLEDIDLLTDDSKGERKRRSRPRKSSV